MQHFQIHIKNAEEIIPRLGKQERHWKVGRSAYELCKAWMGAEGIPPVVRGVLNQAMEWKVARFLEGIFERETALPGGGMPSQTDLLAILALQDGNAILGLEGKVDEPFRSVVAEWLGAPEGPNRRARLDGLCKTLGVEPIQLGTFTTNCCIEHARPSTRQNAFDMGVPLCWVIRSPFGNRARRVRNGSRRQCRHAGDVPALCFHAGGLPKETLTCHLNGLKGDDRVEVGRRLEGQKSIVTGFK